MGSKRIYFAIKKSKEEFFNELNFFLKKKGLSFSEDDYKRFLKDKNEFYEKPFCIPKKNGKKREIRAPQPRLKEVQRYVLKKHIYGFRPHDSATGFILGRSIVHNAKKHVGQSHVYNLDLKDFFPSIHSDKIFSFLDYKSESKENYSKELQNIIVELCTLNGALPQGAPTSPAISNIVCYRMDTILSSLAKKCKLNYSRYADDITFSGKYIKNSLRRSIKNRIMQEGFEISKGKERLIKRKKNFRQEVTGIVVNRKLSIGRTKYNMLRALLHNCAHLGIIEVQEDSDRRSGNGYFMKKGCSGLKIDFFNYIIGAVNTLGQIGDHKKHISVLKKIMGLNWAEYYRELYANATPEGLIEKSKKSYKALRRFAEQYKDPKLAPKAFIEGYAETLANCRIKTINAMIEDSMRTSLINLRIRRETKIPKNFVSALTATRKFRRKYKESLQDIEFFEKQSKDMNLSPSIAGMLKTKGDRVRLVIKENANKEEEEANKELSWIKANLQRLDSLNKEVYEEVNSFVNSVDTKNIRAAQKCRAIFMETYKDIFESSGLAFTKDNACLNGYIDSLRHKQKEGSRLSKGEGKWLNEYQTFNMFNESYNVDFALRLNILDCYFKNYSYKTFSKNFRQTALTRIEEMNKALWTFLNQQEHEKSKDSPMPSIWLLCNLVKIQVEFYIRYKELRPEKKD